jgi:hypothetical protein
VNLSLLEVLSQHSPGGSAEVAKAVSIYGALAEIPTGNPHNAYVER